MSLASKLIVVFLLLSLVPLALVGYLAYADGRKALEQAAIDRLLNITLLKEAEFLNWLDEAKADIRFFAQRPLVRQYATALTSYSQTDPEYQVAYDRMLQDHFLPGLEGQNVFLDFSLIRAADGLILVSSRDDLEGKYRETETFFIEGQTDTYIGNVDYEVTMGEQVMHISTPVKDDQGAVIAVLSGHVNLTHIAEIMTRRSGIQKSEETYLVNTFNFMVTASLFESDPNPRQSVYSDGVTDCLAQHNGSDSYDDYRGVYVIGAYRWMSERQLCIITEIDESESLAPIIDLRRSIFLIAVGISLGVVVIAMFFARTITGPLHKLVEGANEIGRGNLDYRIGMASKDEIGRLSRAFDRMAEALKTITVSRNELEQIIAERTVQLEVSNKELEAFSYSVSHDLRAPLRAMDGFSRILIEDYASDLPSEARRFLGMVRDNAQQMGKLIDHLLTFSRLGRQQLTKEQVAPAAIVESVLKDLAAAQEGRVVNVIVGDLPPCYADPTLLRQVFANLLENAFKFTATREEAVLEVGCRTQNGEQVFFVKDNGVGFDMQYANKLFGVFQRLHNVDDYEGTGIGLATVQRIILRHNGRVWAEAEVGLGTTFYFTLEGDNSHG